jgi:hypothetical protein
LLLDPALRLRARHARERGERAIETLAGVRLVHDELASRGRFGCARGF